MEGVEAPQTPRRNGLAQDWAEVQQSPHDNPLKRKAEGLSPRESSVVGGLATMLEEEDQEVSELASTAADELYDSESDAEEWLEDDEVDPDAAGIAEAREAELDNWERFHVGYVKDAREAEQDELHHCTSIREN